MVQVPVTLGTAPTQSKHTSPCLKNCQRKEEARGEKQAATRVEGKESVCGDEPGQEHLQHTPGRLCQASADLGAKSELERRYERT